MALENIAPNNTFEWIRQYTVKGTFADDTAAASAGVEIGELYIETSTGYVKQRIA